MLEYLIKSILCLLVLFSFYKFFLENESAHNFKRFYLLGAVLLAFFLPLITISYSVEYPAEALSRQKVLKAIAEDHIQEGEDWSNYFRIIILWVYFTGVGIFALRFFRNMYSIIKEIKSNKRLKKWNYIIVLIREKLVPHTFLNYIFLNREEYEKNRISASVLQHEKAHVDQKHSLDIILIELLQVIFWFNPVFIWLKRSVKLNHEFLADREVLSKHSTAMDYSNLLFNYTNNHHHNSLSSSINNSSTRLTIFGKTYVFGNSGGQVKKRIIMISKSFSLKRFISRIGILIPVLALCIYFFNNDIVAKPVLAETEIFNNSNKKLDQDPNLISISVEEDRIRVNGTKVKLDDFSKYLDNLVEDRSNAEIKQMRFHIQTKNANEGLLDLLNKEYAKTRFSKVTGHSILPPPPPAPPAPDDVPPPPAVPNVGENVPVPPRAPEVIPGKVPPAPAAPRVMRKHDSIRRYHLNNKKVQIREQMRMEREMRRAEIEKEREKTRSSRRDSLQHQREEVRLKRIKERKVE